MEHNDIRHRLSEYIDGSVTGEERAAIETHLKTCPQCSSALDELRKTIGHIKSVEEIEPPAWMTQKIMATIRAEAAEKKGFFHRFFFPLRIKLPIQAIAVLFLAVTGFYIYQTAERFSEAPTHELATRNEAPPVGTAQDKLAKSESPALRSKQVPQTPAYKALDMKQGYETPPPPMLKGRATAPVPVPAQPAEPPMRKKDKVMAEQPTVSPYAGAPSLPQEQTAPAAHDPGRDEGRHEPAPLKRQSSGLSAGEGSGSESARSETILTVSVKNIDDAAEDIEATIREFDGTIIETQQLDKKKIYVLSLDTSHAKDLVEKLKHMGAMKEQNLVLKSRESRMVFRIELNKRSAPKAAVGC